MQLKPRERLIVALDLSSVEAAKDMVARLGDTVSFYKIGYQLAFAGGLDYAPVLAGAGCCQGGISLPARRVRGRYPGAGWDDSGA